MTTISDTVAEYHSDKLSRSLADKVMTNKCEPYVGRDRMRINCSYATKLERTA